MISVVVCTRDRPRHLDLCLSGLAAQRPREPFEVVVADDGSGPETRSLLGAWAERAPFPLLHLWEENHGFRLARTRNRGLRAARGEYLIFLDGDCVPPPGFVAAHSRARRPGSFLAGSRLLFDRPSTEALPAGREGAAVLWARVAPREGLAAAGRAALDRAYRLLGLKDRPKPLGANLSAWRSDLWAVNGFDERYVGWGYEDEDLGRRLVRRGVRKRFLPAAGRVVHLYHESDPTFRGRAALSDNAGRFQSGLFLDRCRRGLVPRPLEGLTARVLGLAGVSRSFPLSPPAGAPAELELHGPGQGAYHPRSEARLGVRPGGREKEEFPGAQAVLSLEGELETPQSAVRILRWLEEVL